MSDELVVWLTEAIEARGWSMRELARRAGLSHATVSQVLSQQQKPTWNFCAAIARPLRVPEDTIFILAGLKRRPPPAVDEEREVVAIVRSLPVDVRQWMMVMLRGLAREHSVAADRLVDADQEYEIDPLVGHLPLHVDPAIVDPDLRDKAEELLAIWRRLQDLDPEAAERLMGIAVLQGEMVLTTANAAAKRETEGEQEQEDIIVSP